LVSFAYNVGAGNLKASTLLKKLNAGDTAGAAQEFQRWNKAAGKVLPGLTRRRACEALLFQSIPDKNYDGVAD
jgi:lysozyme